MNVTDILIAASPVPLGIGLYMVVSHIARRAVLRSRAKRAERQDLAHRMAMARYRSTNTLGTKSSSPTPSSSATAAPSSWEPFDQAAGLRAAHVQVHQAHSEPSMVGGGGGFSGAGASGGWESSSCGSSGYSSSSSSDSGSCSSSSSGSD